MAVSVVSTLYPPLLETFQPAFVYNEIAPVTFSLSPFNNINDITRIHVSVVDQRNNSNVLKGYMSPIEQTISASDGSNPVIGNYCIVNGILIADIPIFDNNDEENPVEQLGIFQYDFINDLYAINIDPQWLSRDEDSNYWNNNQYYQVQIRFDSTSNGFKDGGDSEKLTAYEENELAGYLLSNREHFSEWSSITLLKPILKPSFYINQLDRTDRPRIYPGNFRITGYVKFDMNETSNEITSETSEEISETSEEASGTVLNENTTETSNKNGISSPETEKLRSYKISAVYENQEIYNSGWIYPKQTILKEEEVYIDHLLDLTKLPNNIDSQLITKIIITGRTNNNFIWEQSYSVPINPPQEVFSDVRWNQQIGKMSAKQIFVNQEDGIAHIDWSCNILGGISNGIIYFRRACSKDNFKTWDLIYRYIYQRTEDSNKISVPFDDYTISSLYEYKYCAQMCIITNDQEDWSKLTESEEIYPEFYEMLFMRQGRQIAVRYNGQITSWKPTVNRQKIDTLGGRYPKFVENANMNYKTYSISGLISAEEDFNRTFLNELDDSYSYNMEIYNTNFDKNKNFKADYLLRNDTYADGTIVYPEKNQPTHKDKSGEIKGKNLYVVENGFSGQLNEWYDSYPHNHWYWEREFREELVQWLNDGEPKLYRSMPEGNIAVMLTDINLTPNPQLGRMLYNFSATMYEIADGYNLEDLNSLGIISIPTAVNNFINGTNINGKISETTEKANIGVKTDAAVTQITISYNGKTNDWINNKHADDYKYQTSEIWNDMSLADQISEQRLAHNNERALKTGTIKITNADIYFTSPPSYFTLTTSNGTNIFTNSTNQAQTKWLGYVLEIDGKQIFINQKGYYHIPDTVNIKTIKVLNGIAQLTCVYDYYTETTSTAEYVPEEFVKHIIGQYTRDTLPLNTDIINLIGQDYYKLRYFKEGTKDITESIYLKQCSGISLDLTPYAYLTYTYKENEEDEQSLVTKPLLIGETGIFDGFKDWTISSLLIYGRRFIPIPIGNEYPYHIEEYNCYLKNININSVKKYSWEDIDNLTINTPRSLHTSDIKNPDFNCVYKFDINEDSYYQIYYIDGKWYPAIFMEDGSVLAAVPIYGMINYHGNLMTTKHER